jgi:hypothetical protein
MDSLLPQIEIRDEQIAPVSEQAAALEPALEQEPE